MFERAARRGMADEAAERIRDAIFGGVVPPGSQLREIELAAELDISRGSVREGLAVLEAEGLVRSEWHRGTKVIDVTVHDVEEVYAVRAALEGLATSTAIGRVSLDELDEIVAVMLDLTDDDRLLALDMRFHDTIYQATGNARLISAWRALRSQVYLFQLTRVRLNGEHYRAIVVDEHREIVAMLRRGDPEAASRYAEEHVHEARAVLVAALSP
ncbi:GntR family transcriptional regulator [Actinocrispum wychmicini]|uniref:DNA-binding GntR family transcriptional regulator n=1 Tax=Actinocrispum wychmicini TaxID=1213861 RepID=A0A4R2J0C1_9PSEU|nr:GntR family transcriptional regulator [Actinocrispum wychmicini]TCO50752.1 DNA-binding GntR family transcriptional regulator [Actinocrispum wychmicini]